MTTALEGGERSASLPGRFLPPGKDPIPIVQVWKGAENLASTGIRSPDRPARSQSLYRLRYQAHCDVMFFIYWLWAICDLFMVNFTKQSIRILNYEL